MASAYNRLNRTPAEGGLQAKEYLAKYGGRNGEIIAQVRGDNTGPHTIENSFRKAYTARTFRSPSGELVQRVKDNPTLGLIHLTNVIANQGALPIKVGDDVIGAAGASGAPGGEKDEACIKAGIDKVADQLK